MSNQYYNFYYDPIRQGYDLDTWSTITGAPVVASNVLSLDAASVIHYADILHGDSTFSINISEPAAGDDIVFGFHDLNQVAGVGFRVTDDDLYADAFIGANITSTLIAWEAGWTDINTEFRVKWDAGRAIFYINGTERVVTSDENVPGGTLNLYIKSDSTNPLSLNYIIVKGVQNLI
jgi:hypothetical protein